MAATDPKDSVYNTKTLSKWFAIGSIALLIIAVWTVIEDYDRDWKRYARQQQQITARLAEADLKRERGAVDRKQLEATQAEIKKLQEEQEDLTEQLDEKIAKREAVYYKINQEYQFAKANLEAELFQFDNAVKKRKSDVAQREARYERNRAEVTKIYDRARKAEAAVVAAQNEKAKFLSKQKEAQDRMTALLFEQERLQKVIALNETNLGNLARNAPLVDFIAPTVKINQIILPNLKDDYNFNKVPRVDRCMTCHANANKVGYEDFPQPFTSHPNLKLYMAPDSKHPVERIGCTVCHGGVPQSVDFGLAGHIPRDAQQEAEWEAKYGYHRPHHLPTPMIPTPMTEGKCIQCHAKQIHLDGAPTFNAGMRLIERYGCYTCHKFAGNFEKLKEERKPGPTLQKIASKLDPEWVKKFIWDPKSFRPTSLMPRFWKNDNNSDPVSIARGLVEVDAITHYIFKQSKPYQPMQLASAAVGNAARGKEIVGSVGCLGCHAVEDFPRKNPPAGEWGHMDPRIPMFGPELNQSGSKLKKDWLVSWLVNPKHYWEDANMPSMKLSAQEATDVAEYLLEKRNPAFEQIQMLAPSDGVRDAILMEYFEKQVPRDEAQAKLASMSLVQKKDFLGQKFIEHYGCYSCHAIEGFEKAPYVGPELTLEGSKDITKFDFANVHLPKTRADWIFTKIRNPRIWDVGKDRDFEAKVKMPYFNFTDEQATAITAIILGHENKNVDDEAIQKIDGRMEAIIAGHRQVTQHNCIGCHNFEQPKGWGGDVLAHYAEDITMGPPNLNTEGDKAQTGWLHSFLLNPNVMIRPWLKIRMPQFMLTEKEGAIYTQYFAAHDRADYPFAIDDYGRLSPEQVSQARQIIEQLACLTCHGERAPGAPVEDAAPHFKNVKARLRGPWIRDWLKDPQAIMPGSRMPTLWPSSNPDDPKAPLVGVAGILDGDAERQIELVRDYLMQYEGAPALPTPRPRRENRPAPATPTPAAAR